ncbi:unnamed protein product, partial [Timema podura]|nr:unnamed protein product [Timema podura]
MSDALDHVATEAENFENNQEKMDQTFEELMADDPSPSIYKKNNTDIEFMSLKHFKNLVGVSPEVSTEELDRIIDDGVTNFELSLYALEEKKFKELTIDLDFKVPLSHTVEKSFTHSLSNIDREKFQDLGIKLKTGRYNPEEDAILKENWDYFSTEYGFDDPVLFLPGKFKELTIDLDFKVPLSHTVEKSFTHSLSNIDREKFQDLGIKLKTGRYNPEEDAILKENWDYFSTEYGFDDPVLFLPGVTNLLSTKQRKKFVQLLGKGLGHRSLNSIYLRFATLYTPQDENRKFTSYENKLILRCIEREISMPFVILSKLIGKERHAISKHYKILKMSKQYKESQLSKWDYDSVKLLIETLLTVSGENDVEKLRKPIPSTVWDSVGTRINIHPSKCKSYWNNKLSTQLFAKDPVHFNEVCVKFYNVYKFKYWVDVKWTDIALDFDGIGPLFLWRRFRHLVRANVPVMMWQNLKEISALERDSGTQPATRPSHVVVIQHQHSIGTVSLFTPQLPGNMPCTHIMTFDRTPIVTLLQSGSSSCDKSSPRSIHADLYADAFKFHSQGSE